jgi:hypothetical protein
MRYAVSLMVKNGDQRRSSNPLCLLTAACSTALLLRAFLNPAQHAWLLACCRCLLPACPLRPSDAVCIAGFGKATPNSAFCSMCSPGRYQSGGLTACIPCSNATFYPPVDGAGEHWASPGLTTFPGAVGPEFCVTKETQLSPEAGQAYFNKVSKILHRTPWE